MIVVELQRSGPKGCWWVMALALKSHLQWTPAGEGGNGALGSPLVPNFHWNKCIGRFGSYENLSGCLYKCASRCLILSRNHLNCEVSPPPLQTQNITLPCGHASLGYADLLVLTSWGFLWLTVCKMPWRKLRTCLIYKGSKRPFSSEGFPHCRGEELREAAVVVLHEYHPSLAWGQGSAVQETPHWQRLKSDVTLHLARSAAEPDAAHRAKRVPL